MATQLHGPRKGAKAVGAEMPKGVHRLGVIPGENGVAGGDRCVVVAGGRGEIICFGFLAGCSRRQHTRRRAFTKEFLRIKHIRIREIFRIMADRESTDSDIESFGYLLSIYPRVRELPELEMQASLLRLGRRGDSGRS